MQGVQSDSPLMRTLLRIADLVILNLITLLCCIPVVTAGAALTGMHYVLRRMVRDEEGYVVPAFLKSFRENFLQATGMWLLFFLFFAVFAADLVLTGGTGSAADGGAAVQLPFVLRLLLVAGGVYVCLTFLYAFPLLARFQNTIPGTLRSAATLVAAAFPRTLGMAAATLALPLVVFLIPPLLPVLLLCGLTLPGYVCALLYRPVFDKMEGGRKAERDRTRDMEAAMEENREDAMDGM